nr:unnamed protein product [Haemonchus contortus]
MARTTTTTTTTLTTTPSTTITTANQIANDIEQEFPLPTEDNIKLGMSFDETRRRLNEEMREEDERLQQLLADEEAEMSKDEEEEDSEEREEQMRKERERNRMERRERARADERRRQTEEATLRSNGRAQKHRETLESEEADDDDHPGSGSPTVSITLISSICSLSLLLLRY